MTEHIEAVLQALSSKASVVIGLLSSALAVTSANIPAPVDILTYPILTFGPVFVTLQAMITIIGAMTGFTIAIVTLIRFLTEAKRS